MDEGTTPPVGAADAVTVLVRTAFMYGRSMERLRAVGESLIPVKDAIVAVAELEPGLHPELNAALDHITGLLGCVERAATFIDARTDVTLNELAANLNTPPKEEP